MSSPKQPLTGRERIDVLAGVALRLREDQVNETTILGVLENENLERCEPALASELLERIAANPSNFSPPPQPRILTPDEALLKMNKRHAVVHEAGKTVVLTEELDPVLDREVLLRSSFADIQNFYLTELVAAPMDNGQYPTLGRFWLRSSGRREYRGVVFSPGTNPSGYYNLWRGFSVEPKPGDWTRFQQHTLENICSNNLHHFDYVMAWMAQGVQQPERQAEVALVLKGLRGVGKGVFTNGYGSLFGRHYLHIAQGRHLTGNFNAHLQDAVVVFADEAFGADDKQAEGVLKMMITEPSLPIERKFRDVTVAKNVIHLIIASNNDWVIPAGMDERRFFVLEVGNAHQQDHDYFAAIAEEMKNGGREAMLDELLKHDYSKINLRNAPVTPALLEQKIRSMSSTEQWWYLKLSNGRLLKVHTRWQTEVSKDSLYDDYTDTMQKAGVPRRSVQTELGMFLQKVLPPGFPRDVRHSAGRSWIFPPLPECRIQFERHLRQDVTWPEP